MPLINGWIHSSGTSLPNIRRKIFCILSIISVAENLAQFFKTKFLEQHSVGTADRGLSLYRAFSVTGHDGTSIFSKQIAATSCANQAVKTLAVHCHYDVCRVFAGILQGVERPESVYSIMPQWWYLVVLQYVAARFHLPSLSTANINTVQYSKSHQQYEIPTIPAVVISKMPLPQSNNMAASVHSNSSLFFDVSSGLPKYSNYVTQCTVLWFIERSISITQIRKKWDNSIFFAKIGHWNWE